MPLKKYQKYTVAAIPLIIIGLIAYYFSSILTYIILAWILSMVGAPIHFFLKRFVGKTGAALLTLVTFSIITLAIFWAFIPPIIQQARNLSNIDYNEIVSSMEEPLNDWNNWLVEKGILEETRQEESNIDTSNALPPSLIEVVQIDSLVSKYDSTRDHVTIIVQVNHPPEPESPTASEDNMLDASFVERARKNLLTFLNPNRISSILSSIFGALGNTLIGVMSVFFITFFFLKEQGLFTSIVRTISPRDQEEKWVGAFDSSASLLKRYFIGVAFQITLITIFVTTFLSMLGFENALLIGFFAALMNVIPYIGPLLGAVFGIIITISSYLSAKTPAIVDQGEAIAVELTENGFYEVLLPKLGLVAMVFAIMQLLDNFILQPNIFSKSVKAHPLEIFIVILAGAQLGGILGMVIAIPMYTILRVIAKVFLSEFKIVQSITKGI